ncbi:phospholipid carrier-dependent glycosyltransferase [bacterium]|nr:phospholipid carrier-dependent glycosyltransferase [bacterium]
MKIIIVAMISAIALYSGYDWGLPSIERAHVIFEDKIEHYDSVASLEATYKAEKEKTGKKIYIDNYTDYVKSMDYDTAINMGIARYLTVPYAADDAFVLKAIKNLDPYKYDFDPNFYIYGGGLIYASALALKISELTGYVTLKPDISFYLKNPEMMGRIYKVLRLLVLIFSVIGISFVYVYAVRNHGQIVATLTTILMLINPESMASSHAIEPHMYTLVFFALSLFYAYKYYVSNALTYDFMPAAIFAGLSIGTQASSMYIVVPVVVTIFMAFRDKTKLHRLMRDIALYFIIVVIIVILINPYYVINIEGFIQDLYVGMENQVVNDSISINNWAPYQVSIFLLLLYIVSFLYSILVLKKKYVLFYSGIIIPAVVMYIITGQIMQYIYPSIMVFSILSSLMLLDIYSRLSQKFRKYFFIVVLLLLILSPGLRSLYYVINYSYDNRLYAGKWVNNNIEANSSIGITFPPTNYDTIPFNYKKYKLIDIDSAMTNESRPKYVITVNRKLTENVQSHYKLVQEFKPNSILGYRPILKGEVSAIYAKTIKIYKRKGE